MTYSERFNLLFQDENTKEVSEQNDFGGWDITYSDGSKQYETISGDKILIESPLTVLFLENILAGNFTGWGYMKTIQDAYEKGNITQSEYKKIIKILD